jgi:hypothetical protein
MSFEETLMLGRQVIAANDERTLTAAWADAGQQIEPAAARRMFEEQKGWSEPMFRQLGANRVDSVDASGFEKCTFIHDLNEPLPEELRSRYSAVVDGGTLEHVFNFPTALRNALEAVRPGGHFFTISPVNNFAGHGFYQLSPELWYRVLSPENGFRLRCMLWRGEQVGARWYRVADPAESGHRVFALSFWQANLYILAQRTERRAVLATWPQQSDYSAEWARGTARPDVRSPLRRWLARLEPLAIKPARPTLRNTLMRRSGGDFEAVHIADLPRLAS